MLGLQDFSENYLSPSYKQLCQTCIYTTLCTNILSDYLKNIKNSHVNPTIVYLHSIIIIIRWDHKTSLFWKLNKCEYLFTSSLIFKYITFMSIFFQLHNHWQYKNVVRLLVRFIDDINLPFRWYLTFASFHHLL